LALCQEKVREKTGLVQNVGVRPFFSQIMPHFWVRAGFDCRQVRFLREKRAMGDLMGLALVGGFEALNQFIGFGGE